MGSAIRLILYSVTSAALLGAATPLHAQSPAPPDSGRSTLAGVYTTAQATQGENVFRNVCGNCHATDQFTGSTFTNLWGGRTVYSFFDQLRSTMPADNPGGLKPEEYAAVIAYILKLNRHPSGSQPLPATDAALRAIRFGVR